MFAEWDVQCIARADFVDRCQQPARVHSFDKFDMSRSCLYRFSGSGLLLTHSTLAPSFRQGIPVRVARLHLGSAAIRTTFHYFSKFSGG